MPAAQLNRLLRDLDTFADVFDLTRDGLAFQAQALVAETILQDMQVELDPAGVPWLDLSPRYAAWKQSTVGSQPMAVLWGVMRTMENLRGEPQTMTRNEAAFTFGTDSQAQDEASWFQDPDNPNQPPRPFYSLGIPAIAKLDDLFDYEFNRLVR